MNKSVRTQSKGSCDAELRPMKTLYTVTRFQGSGPTVLRLFLLSPVSPSLHTSLCLSQVNTFICLYDDISQTYTTLTTAWPTLTPQEAFYSCCYLSVLFYCKCWKGRAGICQKSFRWIRSRHTQREELAEGFIWTPVSSKHSLCSATVTGGSVSVTSAPALQIESILPSDWSNHSVLRSQ